VRVCVRPTIIEEGIEVLGADESWIIGGEDRKVGFKIHHLFL